MDAVNSIDAENALRELDSRRRAIEVLKRRQRPIVAWMNAVGGIAPLVILLVFVGVAVSRSVDSLTWLVGLISIVGVSGLAAQQRRLRRDLEAVIALLDDEGRYGIRR